MTMKLPAWNRRGPFPAGVLAVDLNGLKWANDEFGHAAGDALLRRAGGPEVPGRCGAGCTCRGDEFACLLPRHTDVEMATLVESLKLVVELNNQFYQGPALVLQLHRGLCACWRTGPRVARGGRRYVRREAGFIRAALIVGLRHSASGAVVRPKIAFVASASGAHQALPMPSTEPVLWQFSLLPSMPSCGLHCCCWRSGLAFACAGGGSWRWSRS